MTLVQRERTLIAILTGLMLMGVVVYGLNAATGAQPRLMVASVAFGLASLGHAIYMLGWQRALTFFALTACLSFLAESLSIATCSVTCYYYTDALGPKLGAVPAVIPISWFTMIYASYVIVNLIAEGQPVSVKGNNVWVIWLALLTALVMTAWDLTLDPFMVQQEKAWVWPQGGEYFGIPLANYVGWIETTFIIVLIYRLVERTLPLKPLGRVTWLVAALPVLSYAASGLPDMWVGVPDATKVIAPFAMGVAILAAAGRVWQMRRGQV